MANIESQFLNMYQEADTMFRRGIYRVFSGLSWNYKTNAKEPYQLSRKNIVSYMFESDWNGGHRLGYRSSAMVNDIDRVVKVITGRTFVPHSLESAINQAMKGTSPGYFEDEDYIFKAFKNQNGHVMFKSQSLVDRLNLEIEKYCNHSKLAKAA